MRDTGEGTTERELRNGRGGAGTTETNAGSAFGAPRSRIPNQSASGLPALTICPYSFTLPNRNISAVIVPIAMISGPVKRALKSL